MSRVEKNNKIHLGIVGCRDSHDYHRFEEKLIDLLREWKASDIDYIIDDKLQEDKDVKEIHKDVKTLAQQGKIVLMFDAIKNVKISTNIEETFENITQRSVTRLCEKALCTDSIVLLVEIYQRLLEHSLESDDTSHESYYIIIDTPGDALALLVVSWKLAWERLSCFSLFQSRVLYLEIMECLYRRKSE